MLDFLGKTAIVTGGTRGIGAACARMLYRRGADVVLTYVSDTAAAEAFEAELAASARGGAGDTSGGAGDTPGGKPGDTPGGTSGGPPGDAPDGPPGDTSGEAPNDVPCGRVFTFRADIADVREIERLIGFVSERFGGLDILVNNAGVLQSTAIGDMTEEEWDRVIDVNLKGVFFMTQKALPLMEARGGGKVVNVTSLAGRNGGFVNGLAYTASKAGVVGLTKGFASRLAPLGVRVNAVAPGTTETDILKNISDEKMAGLLTKIPAGRLGRPEEIAAAVVFLCSDEADFITGAVLDINGGMYFA